MDNILEMRHITKDFSGVKALDDVNLVVRQGEIHALCGENGAGKSTLMNVLSGVYPYGSYTGDIVYKGEVQKFSDIKASEKTGIVIIHQELALIPLLTVAENIFIGNDFTGNHNLTSLDIREVHIGNHVMIGPNTLITTVGHPLSPKGRREYHALAKPVRIGNDVWIGGNVTILPGVTIGNNVVVAAGAVINKDVPDNTLVGGVPARVIKTIEDDV